MLARARGAHREGEMAVSAWGRQPSQCSVDLGHPCDTHIATSATQQMRTGALLLLVTKIKIFGTCTSTNLPGEVIRIRL